MSDLYSIGEVAKQASVSVQTLRHYDKLGLLKPSQISEAGYRYYSERDCAHLKLIRTLRDVGFDLKTIAKLLEHQSEPREILRLQRAAIDEQIESLRRQQIILKAVEQSKEDDSLLSRLQRLKVLAQLDKLEREAFLAKHLAKPKVSTTQSEAIWKAAVLDLPESMTEEQLEVWLELAELAASKRFQALLVQQWEPLEGKDTEALGEWHTLQGEVMARAIQAIEQNLDSQSDIAQSVLDDWIKGFAKVLGKVPDAEFQRWMYEYFSGAQDERMERYWQLIAKLKDMPFSPERSAALRWLLESLKSRVKHTAA